MLKDRLFVDIRRHYQSSSDSEGKHRSGLGYHTEDMPGKGSSYLIVFDGEKTSISRTNNFNIAGPTYL